MKKILPPAQVSEPQWDQLEADLTNSKKFLPVIVKLRARNNQPASATELFDDKDVWSGDDRMNVALAGKKSSHKIARMTKAVSGEGRKERLLALVLRDVT